MDLTEKDNKVHHKFGRKPCASEQNDCAERRHESRGETFQRFTGTFGDRFLSLQKSERKHLMRRSHEELNKSQIDTERRRYKDIDMQNEREIQKYSEELKGNKIKMTLKDDSNIVQSKMLSLPSNETRRRSCPEVSIDKDQDRLLQKETKCEGDKEKEKRNKDSSEKYTRHRDIKADRSIDRMRERRVKKTKHEQGQRDFDQEKDQTYDCSMQNEQCEIAKGTKRDKKTKPDMYVHFYTHTRRKHQVENMAESDRYLTGDYREDDCQKRDKSRSKTEKTEHLVEKQDLILTDIKETKHIRTTGEVCEENERERTAGNKYNNVKHTPEVQDQDKSIQPQKADIGKSKSKFRQKWLEPRSNTEQNERVKEIYNQRYLKKTNDEENMDDKQQRRPEQKSSERVKEKMTRDATCEIDSIKPETENIKNNQDLLTDGTEIHIRNDLHMDKIKVYLETEEGIKKDSENEKNILLEDGFECVEKSGVFCGEEKFEECTSFRPSELSTSDTTTQKEANVVKHPTNTKRDKKGPVTIFCIIGQIIPTSQDNEEILGETLEALPTDMVTQDNIKVYVTDTDREATNTLSPKENNWEGAGSRDQTIDYASPNKDNQIFGPKLLESSEPLKNESYVSTEISIETTEQISNGTMEDCATISEGTESTAKVRKQSSIAAHLQWAHSVVKEILGPATENRKDEEESEICGIWSEGDLRKMTESIRRRKKRNSKFYNSQLYQQYSEVVQNREILLSHSDYLTSRDPALIHSIASTNQSPKTSHQYLQPSSHPQTTSLNNSLKSRSLPSNRPPSPRLSISAFSTTLWQDLPGVRNSPKLMDLNEDERHLQEVRFEVVTSEASYSSSLDIVVEHFVRSKALNALLKAQDKNWLFSRLSDARYISHCFLTDLEEKVDSDIMQFTVCDIIIQHCPKFRQVYVPYLTNQSYQDKTYTKLMDVNHEFRRIVEELESSPVCQRLPLRSFLILPFQRITRLKLLVQTIVKRTIPKTKDEEQAIRALKLLEQMIKESDDSISRMKNIESLVSLNSKVDFECKTLPLISQARRLVKEGFLTELRDISLKERKEERRVYVHLFNDYLLFSLIKEGGRFNVMDYAPVSELHVENCKFKFLSLQKNVFRLHMGQTSLLLQTDTQADKLRWISAISRPFSEIDFTADYPQMQCIRAFVAQQPDELNLEKADVLIVHQQSTDGWVEVTRLSDRRFGWVPVSHLESIVSDKARKRNLLDTIKIATALM